MVDTEVVAKEKRWFEEWFLFLCCLVILPMVFGIVIPNGIAASRGEGTFGTFTAEKEVCDRSMCDWEGDFVSDDGRLRLSEVSLDSDELDGPGDQARAQKVDGEASLYPPGDTSWIAFLVAGLACLTYAICWLAARYRHRRSADLPGHRAPTPRG